MHPLLTYPADAITISPWPEGDADGFDPRSAYVEEFWLGVLGPSTTWLVRRLAASFDDHPDGFELPLGPTARIMGLGDRGGRHSPFLRSVNRLLMFDLARAVGPDHLVVRRRLPPLNHRQRGRLDADRLSLHDAWVATNQGQPDDGRRSRLLALSLLELGEERDAAERQLLRWHYSPGDATKAVAWATERHQRALHAGER